MDKNKITKELIPLLLNNLLNNLEEQGISYYNSNSLWGGRNLAVEREGAILECEEGETAARCGGLCACGQGIAVFSRREGRVDA